MTSVYIYAYIFIHSSQYLFMHNSKCLSIHSYYIKIVFSTYFYILVNTYVYRLMIPYLYIVITIFCWKKIVISKFAVPICSAPQRTYLCLPTRKLHGNRQNTSRASFCAVIRLSTLKTQLGRSSQSWEEFGNMETSGTN